MKLIVPLYMQKMSEVWKIYIIISHPKFRIRKYQIKREWVFLILLKIKNKRSWGCWSGWVIVGHLLKIWLWRVGVRWLLTLKDIYRGISNSWRRLLLLLKGLKVWIVLRNTPKINAVILVIKLFLKFQAILQQSAPISHLPGNQIQLIWKNISSIHRISQNWTKM